MVDKENFWRYNQDKKISTKLSDKTIDDFNVETNNVYTYRIRGYDLNRFSEYSNEVTISTF